MTDQVTTRRVVLSVGVGTGLLCLAVAALAAVALVGVTALHFVPSPSSSKPKIFPRLLTTPPRIPAASIDLPQPDPVEAFGPVNRDALTEPKATPLSLDRVGGFVGGLLVDRLAAAIRPAAGLALAFVGDEIIDEPKTSPGEEIKTGQSDCPNCPNYVPPVGLRVVPRLPQPSYPSYPQPSYPQPSYPSYPQPSYPSYPQPSYPQPSYPSYPQPTQPTQPTQPATPGGSWIQSPRGPVWLPSGFAYEHDSGYLRNLATGERSIPSSAAARPAPLAPYRVPKLPEQPPLADDGLGNWSPRLNPAVPDFTKSPRGERKTGGYACANCRRPTVGDQWATQWTDEGTPISFLCRECWEKMSPEQRQAAYIDWYRRAVE